MSEPPIPHRRRTPCCEIEAFRYLETHDCFIEAAIEKRVAEAVRAYKAELRERVAELPAYSFPPIVKYRAAVLRIIEDMK